MCISYLPVAHGFAAAQFQELAPALGQQEAKLRATIAAARLFRVGALGARMTENLDDIRNKAKRLAGYVEVVTATPND